MSATQVLAPGMPVPSAGARPSSSDATVAERGDASFSDTLDQAARSGEVQDSDTARRSPERMREGGKRNGAAAGDREDGEMAAADPAQVRVETSVASELSAMIAAIGGTSTAPVADAAISNREIEAVASAASLPVDGVVPPEDVEVGPSLPGQVEQDASTQDADQLLALFKAGANPATAAAAAAAVAAPDNVDVKAAVTGRETHLAVETVASGGKPTPLPEAMATSKSTTATSDDASATLAAALVQVADEAATPPTRATGAATREFAAKPDASTTDAASTTRSAVAVPDADAPSGAALSDQDASGSGAEERQQDGRGSSGAHAQQQSSSQTVPTLASGASMGIGGVGDLPIALETYEPVAMQIAAGVKAELSADGMGSGSSDGVVKVLNIELQPANLGTVTVRIALKDNAITVHLETSQRDALTSIDREREALVGALTAAGYSVDSVTIGQQSDATRFQGLSASLGDGGSSASRGGGAQGQTGHGSGSSSGGEGRSNEPGSGNQGYRSSSDSKDSAEVRRDVSGIYV